MTAPLTHPYNLARLGHGGDAIHFEAAEAERAAIAALADALSLERFAVAVALKKEGASRFLLDYRVEADVTQACVVTLEPVVSHINRQFSRELYFAGTGRRASKPAAVLDLSDEEEDGPEEIDNLHYDLAGPALEEFLLALDPYPRCPGLEFQPSAADDALPENPFAVLKSLKSSK